MTGRPDVDIYDLSFSYNGDIVLEKVNLTINNRDFVWIIGPNGGGKTTLVRLILGLLSPDRGRISVLGESPAKACRRVGYVPQQARLDIRFPVTVLDVALMGRLGRHRGFHSGGRIDRLAATGALEQVGLAAQADMALHQLSGGQQRRLLIARALAADPELLILDEPTANLDRRIEQRLYDLLRRLNERLTVILVSHDPAFVSDFVEEVVCVNRTVAIHPTSTKDVSFIAHLYDVPMRLVRHDREQQSEHSHDEATS